MDMNRRAEILCVGGSYYDFEDPSRSIFTIHDIGHALSNTGRYCGHTKIFYSTAQHSVIVSYLVPKEFAFQGLMHDGHEAFVGDMVSTLKRLIPEYQVIEDMAAMEVRKRFGLPFDLHPSVHEADMIALMTERRDLLPERQDDENRWPQGYEPDSNIIIPISPKEAYVMFMNRYFELRGD